jgi:PST family polysaccharide transporter
VKFAVDKRAVAAACLRTDARNLGSRVAVGAGFALLGMGVRLVLVVGSTAILARLLAPADFGLLAMAMVVTELGAMFTNFGFFSILVQKPRLRRVELDSVAWFSFAIGILLTLLVVAASYPAETFFRDARVGEILRALSVSFVIGQLTVVQSALLRRMLRFDLDLFLKTAIIVTRSAVAVGCALAGFGLWSLVAGTIASQVVWLLLSVLLVPYRPKLQIDTSFLRANLKTSASYLALGLLWYGNTNFDLAFVGRLLGAVGLGYYQTARALTDELRARITVPIQHVLFPAYSLMQNDLARFRAAALRSTRLLAVIIVPMGIGIAATAPSLVRVLYGEQWLPMVPILEVIALAGTVRASLAVNGPIFSATNRMGLSLRLNFVNTALFFIAIAVGSRWGALGVAWGSLASALAFAYVTVRAFGVLRLRPRDLAAALAPPYLAAAVMACAVVATDAWLKGHPLFASFLWQVAVGAATYLLVLAVISRPLLVEALRLAQQLGGRRAPAR